MPPTVLLPTGSEPCGRAQSGIVLHDCDTQLPSSLVSLTTSSLGFWYSGQTTAGLGLGLLTVSTGQAGSAEAGVWSTDAHASSPTQGGKGESGT